MKKHLLSLAASVVMASIVKDTMLITPDKPKTEQYIAKDKKNPKELHKEKMAWKKRQRENNQ